MLFFLVGSTVSVPLKPSADHRGNCVHDLEENNRLIKVAFNDRFTYSVATELCETEHTKTRH